MLPLAVLNLENELCTAEKQGSFWFRGHIDTALPTDAQFIIGDNHRRFHSSLLLGGSQEGGIQAECVCGYKAFQRKTQHIYGNVCCATESVRPPPQVDDIYSSADVVFENNFGDFFLRF